MKIKVRLLPLIGAELLAIASAGSGAPAQTSGPPIGQQASPLVDAFVTAANGDTAAQATFLRERVANAPSMPREEIAGLLRRLATAGGARVISATRRPSGNRLVVTTPAGRVARIDLVAADEAGRVTAIAAVAAPTPYPGPRPAGGLAPTELRQTLDRRVRFAAERDEFSGTVLVTKGDQVVYAASFGKADKDRSVANGADTRFNLGSMDKQFTAVAIGQLVEEGRLSLDARLIDVLPDYPNPAAAAKITVRHLLSHRAGLGMLFERPGWDWKRRYTEVSELLPIFAGAEPAFEPGSRFAYSNEGFVVLGAIIERLSGRSWYDYVQARIFEPTGMTRTAYLTDDPRIADRATGYKFGADDPLGLDGRRANWDTLPWRGNSCGGGFSTAGDMTRFLRALREGKILRSDTAAALFDDGPDRSDRYAHGFRAG